MSRRKKIAIWTVASVSALVVLIAWFIYRAAQQVPTFYEQAIAAPLDIQKARGDELERRALELHNRTRHSGRWEMEITAAQINGWLAVDLPKKFPGLLPPEVEAPRVAIKPNQVLFACRYVGPHLSTVITLTVEVSLTDQPNEVAFHLVRARAGLLPLPLKQVIDQFQSVAFQTGLSLRWAQRSGDPIALLTIVPQHADKQHRRLILETLHLTNGQLIIAGRTERN